jgi:small ligand-binding sensory domain FIST
LYGDVQLDVVVARGCRPVGIPFTITRGHHNLIYELNQQRVLDTLEVLFDTLSTTDQQRFRRSPMLGLSASSESTANTEWLIRAIQGVSKQSGALAINGEVHRGQQLRFHVRDAATAASVLHAQLDGQRQQHSTAPEGALMFNCLGRGKIFYGQEHHDTQRIRDVFPRTPVGGFFCNGELGPQQGRTHFHSYTAVIALFRSRGWS